MPSTATERFPTLETKRTTDSSFNYYQFGKKLKRRNFFNAEGTLAEDSLLEDNSKSSFDLSGPCSPSFLPLRLKGTVVAGSDSFATILQKGKPSILKIGDGFQDLENVSIVAIREKGVILNHNGKKECLYLVKGMTSLDPQATKTEEQLPAAKPAQTKKEFTLKSKWVESKLGASFAKIMQDIYTVPEIDPENGQIIGYKLYRTKASGLFGTLGLKDQDVIISVNGQSMKNNTVLTLYESLHNDSQVTFKYERDDVIHSVKVNIK